jgi:hypothetical protein
MVERGPPGGSSLQYHQRYHRYVYDWIHGPGHLLFELLAHWIFTHQFVSTSMPNKMSHLTAGTERLIDSARPTISSTSPTIEVSSINKCMKHTLQPTCLLVISPSTSGSLQPTPPSYPMLSSTTAEKCKFKSATGWQKS